MRYSSRVTAFETRNGRASLRVTAGPGGLEILELHPEDNPAPGAIDEDQPVVRETLRQLAAYFSGDLKVFDMPLAPKGTEFQLSVWKALTRIPYGETCSYRDIARTIGRPKAVRAVGAANGSNPIAIIVPCHRVI